MPQTSQIPNTPETRKPTSASRWIPTTCGPPVAKTPMMAEPISPPRMTSATAIRFVAWSMWCVELVDAGVLDLNLERSLP